MELSKVWPETVQCALGSHNVSRHQDETPSHCYETVNLRSDSIEQVPACREQQSTPVRTNVPGRLKTARSLCFSRSDLETCRHAEAAGIRTSTRGIPWEKCRAAKCRSIKCSPASLFESASRRRLSEVRFRFVTVGSCW